MGELKDRTGETSISRNGMKMVICEYRKANDIDIQFEDGTIIKHRTYDSFLKGSIRHKMDKPINTVGSIVTATNGQQMTLIKYVNCNDVTVQFEDGTIVEHKSYASFKLGNIGNPNVNIKGKSRIKSKVGESTYNLQGHNMKIIEYRTGRDIDVQFEDGVIAKHKSYDNFKRHKIAHPSYKANKLMDSRVGERNTMNCGVLATIISYRNFGDIDVKFEDNVIVEHTNYRSFVNGGIGHPNIDSHSYAQERQEYKYSARYLDRCKQRIGETKKANCGLEMTITEYLDNNHITVQFETGDIVKNKRYSAFKKGEISPPSIIRRQILEKECIGRKVKLNSGEVAECIAVNNKSDITIRFEDGYTREHVDWFRFLNGGVDRVDRQTKILAEHQKNREIYLGKKYFNNEGEEFTIIEYKKAKDITVQFSNGNIVRHRTLREAELGSIANTTIKRQDYEKLRLGEQIVTCDGCKVTIINYKNSNDIDVQFEDGTVVKSRYKAFKNGKIQHPNKVVDYSKRLGETSYTKSGELMTIIRYGNVRDIDIRFEDGTVLCNRAYADFVVGRIKKNKKTNEAIVGEQVRCKNGLTATVIEPFECDKVNIVFEDGTEKTCVYKSFKNGGSVHPKYRLCEHVATFNNEKIFLCTCKKCKGKHVLALSEMKDFICTGK